MHDLTFLTTSQLKALRHRILGALTAAALDYATRNALLTLLGQIDQRLTASTFQPKGPRYGRR